MTPNAVYDVLSPEHPTPVPPEPDRTSLEDANIPRLPLTPDSVPPQKKKFSEIFPKISSGTTPPLAGTTEQEQRVAVTDSIIKHVRAKGGNNIVSDQLFKELAEFYFPTELLFQVDQELLRSEDWRAVNAALDRVHKFKGSFTRKIELTVHGADKVKAMSDAELADIIEGTIIDTPQDADNA